MKVPFFLLTVLLLTTQCGSSGNSGSSNSNKAIDLTPVKGYFVKNTTEDSGNTQCFVFTGPEKFSEVCGTAATMSSKPDTPDFKTDLLIAIVGTSTDRPTTINIAGSRLEKNILTVDISEDKTDEVLSYTMRPLTLVSAKKDGVKKVIIKKGGQEIFSSDI